MTASIAPLPHDERPLSEQYRLVAKAWADAHAAACLLEETKSAVLAKMMRDTGLETINRAEMTVKASDEWTDHVTRIVDARKLADLKRVQMKYIEMKFSEWQAKDATSRAEMRLQR